MSKISGLRLYEVVATKGQAEEGVQAEELDVLSGLHDAKKGLLGQQPGTGCHADEPKKQKVFQRKNR